MESSNSLYDQPLEFEFNFSSRLYRASTIMDERMGDGWLLYAPDFKGLPILLDDFSHDILNRFNHGAVAGEVLSASVSEAASSFDRTLDTISFLEEHGFLRNQPTKSSYADSAA